LKDLIQLNKEWFESVFDVLNPWSESYLADHIIVWARCYDLPFSLWNKDYFSKVVGEIASLISVDKATESWEIIEYVRLQVRVPRSCRASLSKGMCINGEIYSINIKEEDPRVHGGLRRWRSNLYTTSECVSSLESFVEETVVSEDNVFREELQVYEEGLGEEGAGSGSGGRQPQMSLVEDGSGTRFQQGPIKVPFSEPVMSGPVTDLVRGVQRLQSANETASYALSDANVTQDVLANLVVALEAVKRVQLWANKDVA